MHLLEKLRSNTSIPQKWHLACKEKKNSTSMCPCFFMKVLDKHSLRFILIKRVVISWKSHCSGVSLYFLALNRPEPLWQCYPNVYVFTAQSQKKGIVCILQLGPVHLGMTLTNNSLTLKWVFFLNHLLNFVAMFRSCTRQNFYKHCVGTQSGISNVVFASLISGCDYQMEQFGLFPQVQSTTIW